MSWSMPPRLADPSTVSCDFECGSRLLFAHHTSTLPAQASLRRKAFATSAPTEAE